MQLSELECRAPLTLEFIREFLTYRENFSLEFDQDFTLRDLRQVASSDHKVHFVYKYGVPEENIVQKVFGRSGVFNPDALSDDALSTLLHQGAMIIEMEYGASDLEILMQRALRPYLLNNPSAAYGKKGLARGKALPKKGATLSFVFSRVFTGQRLDAALCISAEHITDFYYHAIDRCKTRDLELQSFEGRGYSFKITVTNREIDKQKYKSIDGFWEAVEKQIDAAFKTLDPNYLTLHLDYKSPRSSGVASLPEAVLLDNFETVCALLRQTDLPRSATLETFDYPKNRLIRHIYP